MVQRSANGFHHPQNVAEVAELVRQAAAEGVKLRVRGSAHSVLAAIYTGNFNEPPPEERGINVYLDKLTAVSFDDASKQVTVQAGCHLGKDPFDPAGTSKLENSLLYQMQRKGWAFPATGGIICG